MYAPCIMKEINNIHSHNLHITICELLSRSVGNDDATGSS